MTHALGNSLKRVVMIAVSVAVLNHKFTPLGLAGCTMAIGGVMAYSITKARLETIGVVVPVGKVAEVAAAAAAAEAEAEAKVKSAAGATPHEKKEEEEKEVVVVKAVVAEGATPNENTEDKEVVVATTEAVAEREGEEEGEEEADTGDKKAA